jgi:hypothetical protein
MHQQNHKLNTSMAATHTNLKIELVAVAVTFKDQLIHLKMANLAETCNMLAIKRRRVEDK